MAKTKAPDPAPAPDAAPSVPDAPAPAPELVKARVLITGHFGKVDDVVEVTAEQAADPDLDAHPDAVAYAESLKQAAPTDQG